MRRRTLIGALESDAKRRRDRAQREAAERPAAEIVAHNQCIEALVALEPPAALAVVTKIQRSIAEFISVQARS